jgi:hypothetical protein
LQPGRGIPEDDASITARTRQTRPSGLNVTAFTSGVADERCSRSPVATSHNKRRVSAPVTRRTVGTERQTVDEPYGQRGSWSACRTLRPTA